MNNGGQGSFSLRADTWLAEMKETDVGAVVDEQRNNKIFQEGWRMLLQESVGHSIARLREITFHDLCLEDFWHRPENCAVLLPEIMMKPL